MKKIMRKVIIPVFLAALISPAHADEDNSVFSYGKFAIGAKVYLFGDNVNIRNSPSVTSGNIAATLPVMHPVKILEAASSTFTMNGYKTFWYKIGFSWKGSEMTGYVWGGLISMVTIPINGNTYALCGITGCDSDKGFSAEVRIVQNKKIISSVSFRPMQFDQQGGSYNYGLSGKLYGSRGFDSIKNIISIHFSYPACGYTNGDIIFMFDGKKIHYGIRTPSVAEAGVFHWTTTSIFPDQKGGVKNMIIQEEKTDNYNEKKQDYVTDKVVKKRFRWDGTKFVEVKS